MAKGRSRLAGARLPSRRALITTLSALSLLVLSACTEERPEDGTSGPTSTGVTTDTGSIPGVSTDISCETADILECARLTTIGDLVPESPEKASGTPIKIGMVNQENTPAGSYPELSKAVQAGIAFVNDQLGGVNGRPLEVEVCNTKFSPEGSIACAQQFVQDEVPVVMGGIDVFGNGIEILEANGVPYVGGIPISYQSVRATNSFQFSGGTWGAMVAFAQHAAVELEADSVAIVYGQFGPIEDGAKHGEATLKGLGVDEVKLVPNPILETDLSSAVQVAASGNPDAIFFLSAETSCKGAFDAAESLGTEAKLFFPGSCAAPAIMEQIGPENLEGVIFNIETEARQDRPNHDLGLFISVAEEYGDNLDPLGAGTVSFKDFMNLYRVLRSSEEGDITRESVMDAFKSQEETPNYMGYPYTCDGEQFPGFPAMCSANQILVEMRDGEFQQLGDWLDVGQIYRDATSN